MVKFYFLLSNQEHNLQCGQTYRRMKNIVYNFTMVLDVNIFNAIIAGVFATIAMDLVGILTIRARWIDLNGLQIVPSLLGRWFLHFFKQTQLVIADIRQIPEGKNEKAIGWVLHYLIGICLGLLFAILPFRGLGAGIAYGIFTNIFPWLLMYPAMGFGFFGSRLAVTKKLILFSFINHFIFGLALGFSK